MSKLKDVYNYFKYLKNPISCLLFKFGLKKEITAKIRKSNYKIKISKIPSINNLMIILTSEPKNYDFIEYIEELESEKEVISILDGSIKIYNPATYTLNVIFAEIYSDYYSNFDIDYKNRVIIDIGANSGDTALYFALKGCSEVYAYEPVKEYYEMALKNFELNPKLNKKIHIFNNAVSYKESKLNIDSMNSVSPYIDKEDSYEINVLSMNDIIKNIEPDLLKMDCEGCEFEIIENCDLSMFNELIFEYHSKVVGKDCNILIDKLKKEGFKIDTSTVFSRNTKDLGIIHAYK